MMAHFVQLNGKRWTALIFILLLTILVTSCGSDKKTGGEQPKEQGSQAGQPAQTLLSLGTAGSAGTYYLVGSGISDVMSKYVEGVKVTPQGTAGGVENLRRMASKQMDMAIISPLDLDTVLKDGTVKPEQIRVMSGGHVQISHVVARPDSPYENLDDAIHKGVKIGIGAPGSALQASCDVLLYAYDLKRSDVKAFPLSMSEQVDALKDKTIEVGYMYGSIPLPAVTDLAQALGGVKILGLPDNRFEKIKAKVPFTFKSTIPAGTYKGQDKPVTVTASAAVLVCRADLPEGLIYKLVKAMYEHSDEIAKVHPAGADYNAKNALNAADFNVKLGYKYHPGTIKYLKEKNLWDPKYE